MKNCKDKLLSEASKFLNAVFFKKFWHCLEELKHEEIKELQFDLSDSNVKFYFNRQTRIGVGTLEDYMPKIIEHFRSVKPLGVFEVKRDRGFKLYDPVLDAVAVLGEQSVGGSIFNTAVRLGVIYSLEADDNEIRKSYKKFQKLSNI